MGTNRISSKDRILSAIEHRESDKIPVDLGGSVQSIIKNLNKMTNFNTVVSHKFNKIVMHNVVDIESF